VRGRAVWGWFVHAATGVDSENVGSQRNETEGAEMKSDNLAIPAVVDRDTFNAQVDALRVREKAHTREGDAIAAARRRLPMVEVDARIPLIGPNGSLTLLDAFEGRRAHRLLLHVARRTPSG
jgi:hypothetical protein